MYLIIMMSVSMLGAFVFTVFSYLGFFLPVEMHRLQSAPLTLIYRDYMGPYHKSVETLISVEKWAKENGTDCKRTFGQYIDDPDIVATDRLRSKVGCVTDTLPKQLPEDIKVLQIPARDILKVTFAGSPAIGPTKVYPEAQEWMNDNGFQLAGPTIEIHLVQSSESMTTEYHFPLKPRPESQAN